MRLVFMGTPDFACPTLIELAAQGHEIAAVFTRAPKPAGRGMAEQKSPVHAVAERLDLTVQMPATLRGEGAADNLAQLGAEAAIVVAYGLLLPKPVLDAFPLGCFNLHASLLPRWRGAAPIQRAIMAGDAETGVMVMRMEAGLDTGPVAMAERVAIEPDMTALLLHDRLKLIGADLMARAVAALSRGALHWRPQAEAGVTYAKKIEKAEARIDWSRPALDLRNHVHALSPFPGAWFEADWGDGLQRVKALKAELAEGSGPPGRYLGPDLTIACGTGALRLVEVQRAGRGAMAASEFLRGAPLRIGQMLA
jgi:methionyl-tRNA formyltransferase